MYLKDDVTDVEHGEHRVVVIAGKLEVFLKSSQTRIANVCPVNEAEQVQERNGGDDVEIDLQPQPRLGLGVERDERVTVPIEWLAKS
jgi:hypothetical protein